MEAVARHPSMSLERIIDLRASIENGPELTVVDCCSGGVLVRSARPLDVGTTTRIHLFTPDGSFSGSFALRCLHAHRASDLSAPPAYLSALVFEDEVGAAARAVLTRLGDKDVPNGRPDEPTG